MAEEYTWDNNLLDRKQKREYFPFDLYDNQIVIQISKEKKNDEIWFSLKKEALINAVKDLSKPALELYLYLASNKDKYWEGLSPKHIKNIIGMSESSYRRGVAELKEKRYLIYTEKQVLSKNDKEAPKWVFYIEPQPVSKND